MSNFGERLRALRKSDDMTQAELAMALGTDQSAVSRWERSAYPPSVETLRTVADYFGIEQFDLLGDMPAKQPNGELNHAKSF